MPKLPARPSAARGDLIERPGRDWTQWKEGTGEYDVERVWWQARVLHFPKLNVTVWFDGSELVRIKYWDIACPSGCMRLPPADWRPMPAGYRHDAEQAGWHAATGRRQVAREGIAGLGLGTVDSKNVHPGVLRGLSVQPLQMVGLPTV
jgi:hypothetical protein